MHDPFLDDPFNFDDPEGDEMPWDESTKERKSLTLTDDGKVVITLKGGPGFEAPWIVIHAGSVDEAEDTLDEVYSKGLQHKVTKAAAAFSTGGSSGGRTASRSNPPGVASKTCQHGEMTYRTGTSAKGAWKAYFCPAEDKNEQCSPVWVK